jgi:hypothetical protein
MQVRAHHGVDAVARPARLLKPLQEGVANGSPPVISRGRSLPTQVSTISFNPGASTRSAWMLSFRMPSSSLTKCG